MNGTIKEAVHISNVPPIFSLLQINCLQEFSILAEDNVTQRLPPKIENTFSINETSMESEIKVELDFEDADPLLLEETNRDHTNIKNKTTQTDQFTKEDIQSSDEEHRCPECPGKLYKSKKHLQKHTEELHTNLTIYTCSVDGCNKKFRHLRSMKEHSKYCGRVCPRCHKSYSCAKSFRVHICKNLLSL